MKPKRQRASELLEKFVNKGVPDTALLDFILNNYMSGDEALDALLAAEDEFFSDADDFYSEKEYDTSSFDEEE